MTEVTQTVIPTNVYDATGSGILNPGAPISPAPPLIWSGNQDNDNITSYAVYGVMTVPPLVTNTSNLQSASSK